MKFSVAPRAFSLVEVTLALGIAAFCLMGIFALLPVGVTSNRDSVRLTHASCLAAGLVTDLQATKKGDSSLIYGIKPDTAVNGALFYLKEEGTKMTSVTDADYRATVTIVPPASAGVIAPTKLRILLTWPAAVADPLNSFEVVTALDRN